MTDGKGQTTSYQYSDLAGQLTQITRPDENVSFQYDELGITGTFYEFDVTFTYHDGEAYFEIDLIEGEKLNLFGIFLSFLRYARAQGAQRVLLEGTFANETSKSYVKKVRIGDHNDRWGRFYGDHFGLELLVLFCGSFGML
jgi:YD repeat-containing protein